MIFVHTPIWLIAVFVVGYFIWNVFYPAVYNGAKHLEREVPLFIKDKERISNTLVVLVMIVGLLIWRSTW